MTGGTFVGRQSELRELAGHLAAARAGARMVVVTGEPGIGKSRLLAELRRRHPSLTFLIGRGSPMSVALPFATLGEALESHLRRMSPDAVVRLAGERAAALALLLPSVAAARPEVAALPTTRLATFEAIGHVLAAIASERPAVLCLDDVHQADPSTWDALNYLGRNPPGAQLLMVACTRAAELGRPDGLGQALGPLLKDGLAAELPIGPLNDDEVGTLAEARLEAPGRELIAWLRSRTRGNPLYLLALLEELRVDPQRRVVPASVTERVRLQVGELPASARRLLELAAVVGEPFEPRWLLGLDAPLAPELDRLLDSGLLAAEADGTSGRCDFAHPLVQEAVYALSRPSRRRELHARVAAAESLDLSRRAYHAARGALPGDEWAIDLLRRAARFAESSPRQALEHLGHALELLPPADTERRAEILDVMAWQASNCSDHLAGVKALEQLQPLLPDEPGAQATNHIRLASFLSTGAADLVAAERHAATAVRLLSDTPDGRLAAAINELAWIRGEGGDLTAQIELSRRALRLAVETGDRRVEMHALGALGHGLGLAGDSDESIAVLSRALRLAEAAGDREQVGWQTGSLAQSLLLAGQAEEAAHLLEDLLTVPNPSQVAYASLARVQWFRGRWAGALEACLRMRAMQAETVSAHSAWTLSLGAHLLVAMGRDEEANVLRAEAERVYAGRAFYCFSAWHDWSIGLIEWDRGDLRAALARLEAAHGRLVVMGGRAAARQVLPDLAALRGVLAGHPVPASLDEATADPVPFRRARALELLAPDLRGKARLQALTESAGIYERLPAQRNHQRILRSLRESSGRRPARGIGPLTSRERAVARLAAQGLTAREIGQRLQVSIRTAESHLGHVYAKLGVSGRVELRTRLETFGEPPILRAPRPLRNVGVTGYQL